MPKFIYTARGFDGKTKGGEIVSKDERMAASQLRSEGFLVTSIKEMKEDNEKVSVKFLDRFSSVPLKDKMIFAKNLSVMIGSGLAITRALKNLETQTRNKKLKKILEDVHNEVQSGKGLSESLAKYPTVFNELFVNMVKIGEIGGTLEEVLGIISVQLEKEHELKKKVLGAMIYPAIVVIAMVGIGALMLMYILPRITSVFDDMEVTLPKSTQFMITVSDFLREHTILLVIILLIGGFSLKLFLQTKAGKKALSLLVINLPVVKGIVVKVNCARFSRIYSSLLRSGVPALEALTIVAKTLTNYYYSKVIRKGVDEMQKGVDLSKIIAQNPKIFPVLVPQMIEVGEETGKTEVMLMKLAEFYEEEVNQVTKNLSSIVEPVLMLFVGGAVGFFAVSMLQPMYSVMENIK